MSALGRKVASGKLTQRLPYIVPGAYPVLTLNRMFEKPTRKGMDLFIAEWDIAESEVPERPPGTGMSHTFNLTTQEAAPGNIKAMCCALLGFDVESLTIEESDDRADAIGDLLAKCWSSDNPLGGCKVRAEGLPHVTKEGKQFTIVRYSPLDVELPEPAAEIFMGIAEIMEM